MNYRLAEAIFYSPTIHVLFRQKMDFYSTLFNSVKRRSLFGSVKDEHYSIPSKNYSFLLFLFVHH